ncbi:hypothetical protein OG723_44535 (plasmid) [Streptomyces sp. NBC_01278]|uniref:hypothetical protein n=1 Tax=Streptomyces sp. NBC_01278 TaxID=2903809 RepID=UPI002E2F2E51|nr:hypothetical protein [Streptomyces sp. NBC_01278]
MTDIRTLLGTRDFTNVSTAVLKELERALRGRSVETLEFRDAPQDYTGPVYAVRGGAEQAVPQLLYINGEPFAPDTAERSTQ